MNTTTDSPDRPALDALTADLAAADRLRAIDRLRDGLEHELRSPLNAIVLNVELLKELVRAEGGATAVVQLERLDTIGRALTRLQGGLDDLLRFTREPDDARTRFDLADLVADVEARVSGQFKQRGLRLLVDVPRGSTTRGRREALAQALIDVLIRALRASPPGARVEIAARPEGGRLVLEVRDSGPGIEPERQPGLFESPHEAPRAEPGVGLYVARRLIELDGGELELASTGAEGTVIRAYLREVSQ